MYLSYEEKTFVKKAVKISPTGMQSTGDLLHNVQDTESITDDAIDFSLKKSVQYHSLKKSVQSHGIMFEKSGVASVLSCWMMWRLMTPLGA